jgi:hypothetical protein
VNSKKIILSAPFGEERESKLVKSLHRAGFEFYSADEPQLSSDAICSVHYLSNESMNETFSSAAVHHFNLVNELQQKKEGFKSFFWQPPSQTSNSTNNRLADKIQNELKNNMILSSVEHPIQFIEDILTILEEQPTKKYDTTPSDIFLICSESDLPEAGQLQLLLGDIVKLVKLIIVQETGDDYEEMAAQQMSVSKLAVVYYKRGKNWALPFTQQLWKKVGGAGSNTPICLIGDAEMNAEDEGSLFDAPKVKPMVLPIELIPLEIKVQYDTVTESTS